MFVFNLLIKNEGTYIGKYDICQSSKQKGMLYVSKSNGEWTEVWVPACAAPDLCDLGKVLLDPLGLFPQLRGQC